MNWNKPLPGTQIDREHFLSKGLVSCLVMNEQSGNISPGFNNYMGIWDYARNGFFLNATNNTNPIWKPGPNGIGIYCDGTDQNPYWDVADMDWLLKPDLTIIIRQSVQLSTTRQAFFHLANNTNTDRFVIFVLESNLGGYIRLYDNINIRNVNIDATIGGYSSGWNPVSDIAIVIGKSRGREIYRDGILVGNDIYSATGPEDITPSQYYNGIFALRSNPVAVITNYVTGIYYHMYIYDRALTQNEIMGLWIDPYCFFEKRKPIYFPVGITYNITGSIDSSSTVSGIVHPTFSITGDIGATSLISGSLVSEIEELLYETIELVSSVTKIITEESERESSIDLESIRTDTINLNSKFKE